MNKIKGHPNHYEFPDKQNPALRNWIYRFITHISELDEPEKVEFT